MHCVCTEISSFSFLFKNICSNEPYKIALQKSCDKNLTIVIRKGKTVWKYGPHCWYFGLNLNIWGGRTVHTSKQGKWSRNGVVATSYGPDCGRYNTLRLDYAKNIICVKIRARKYQTQPSEKHFEVCLMLRIKNKGLISQKFQRENLLQHLINLINLLIIYWFNYLKLIVSRFWPRSFMFERILSFMKN